MSDNPALKAAVERGGPVVPVFIWAPEEEGGWAPGAASRWWLHYSLQSLSDSLVKAGSLLILRKGGTIEELFSIIRSTDTTGVLWNRCYEPAVVERDQKVQRALEEQGIFVNTFNSHLFFEPGTVRNKSGGPFQVFSQFWRTCQRLPAPKERLTAPSILPPPKRWPQSLRIEEFGLLPKVDWAAGLRAHWEPGEVGARNKVRAFLKKGLPGYEEDRDRPDLPGTSELSPHLHWGEISVREIFHEGAKAAASQGISEPSWRAGRFMTELGWREFGYQLLDAFPQTPTEPLRADFKRMPWRKNDEWLKAWQGGRTGYPLVDAGLRQLWSIGWMHNRVRMVAASFLTKHLLLPWQEGTRWFWDTLVDADLANNTLGWQWTAGCGADAAPFFRIFNPIAQGEKYDPNGDYVRRWVPELKDLPAEWIHKPFAAPASVLAEAKITLGRDYPKVLVPHGIAREMALEAYAQIKQGGRKAGRSRRTEVTL